ncbi:MAG: aromatic amino acid lyase [Blautia marasmi]
MNPGLGTSLEMLSIAFTCFKGILLRAIKLANPAFTRLTRNLSPQESVIAFSTIQKTFTALDAEIRSLANPVSMDTFPLAGEIEDRSTNAPLAVQRLDKILDDLCYILGIELMLAGQAMDLRRGETFGK